MSGPIHNPNDPECRCLTCMTKDNCAACLPGTHYPASFCNHANENPAVCECPTGNGCYCHFHTCKDQKEVGLSIADLAPNTALKELLGKRSISTVKPYPMPITQKLPPLEHCFQCRSSEDSSVKTCVPICLNCRSKWKTQSQNQLECIFQCLAGSYNHHGIINWFSRPRGQLNGRTPSQAIDDGDIKAVVRLAKGLLDGNNGQ